ncbi:9670_t:CDS:2 [Entrophospora sp. SA101]|nr:9670_t:CDS:2 [Entrophospora sp. SA101]CAJ0920339.1 14244_t:CDS:2 [Entrophospora sp. SA101]
MFTTAKEIYGPLFSDKNSTNSTILISNEIDIMNDPLEETITNVKSFNSEIETTNNNNSLEEIEIFLIEWILLIYSYNIF